MDRSKFSHLMIASDTWTYDTAQENIHDFRRLSIFQKDTLVQYLNEHFPPAVYERQRKCKARALENQNLIRNRLLEGTRPFPRCISSSEIKPENICLNDFGVILTAGGEGERLRLSLQRQGVSSRELEKFSKATFPLPGFYSDFGALHINLSLISSLSEKYKCLIPVIVTTGPESSTTAKVVTKMLNCYSAFGIKNIKILFQSERLHLTSDNELSIKLVMVCLILLLILKKSEGRS